MIGLSLSQSLLRPRQSGVALAAAEEHEAHGHGGGGGGHFDHSRPRESSVLLYTRGQLPLPQHRMMSVAVTSTGMGLGSGHRGARRHSSRRASECPFELLNPRSQSALASARRRSSSARSSSARSGSLASSAFIDRSRVNTSISAPESQLNQSQQQQQHLQPIDVDEPTTQPEAGEALATVRRKEPRQNSHHEQQARRESASELKLRMRAFSQDSACAVIPEEPSDAIGDSTSGFRRFSRRISEESAAAVAAAAVADAGTGAAPVASLAVALASSTSATERDVALTHSQTQLPSCVETSQPQPPDRSRASSCYRENALLAQFDTIATPSLSTSRQAIAVRRGAEQEFLDDVDVEEADEALPPAAVDFNHFTHVRPSDEVWHTLLWGAAVALLLLVSGKLLQWIEGGFEASDAALIASADYSLERALEALIHSCANNCTNNSGHSKGGVTGGVSVNCSDPQSSVSQFVDQLRSVLEQQITNRYATDPSKNKWTFANAVFFQWTAITTIGYGNIAPTSVAGRTLLVVTSVIGIPLFIHFVMHLTRLFLVLVELSLATVVYKCRRLLSVVLVRSHSCSSDVERAFTGPPSHVSTLPSSSPPTCTASATPIVILTSAPPDPSAHLLVHANEQSSNRDGYSSYESTLQRKAFGPNEQNPVLPLVADRGQGPEVGEKFKSAAQQMAQCAGRHLWVVLLMVPPFTLLLALAVQMTEPDWHYLEVLYYTFVTLSTIGFGDLVPTSALTGLLFTLPTALGIGLYAVTFEAMQNALEPLPGRLASSLAAMSRCCSRRLGQKQYTREMQQSHYQQSTAPIVVNSDDI